MKRWTLLLPMAALGAMLGSTHARAIAPEPSPPAPEPSIVLPEDPPPSPPEPSLTLPQNTSPAPEPEPPVAAPIEEPSPETTEFTDLDGLDQPAASPTDEPSSDDEGDGGQEPFDLQPPAPNSAPGRAASWHRPRTPTWGKVWLTLGPIVNFGGLGDVGLQHLGFGIEGTRFLIPHLGLGLAVEDIAAFVGPTINLFRITPKATLLVMPYRRFTPILMGGFGGAFYSRGGGAYGRWTAAGGFLFAIADRFSLGFGVEVEGLAPQSKFYQRFECTPAGSNCHIGYGPWSRFGFRF